jgi:hypothetical protein
MSSIQKTSKRVKAVNVCICFLLLLSSVSFVGCGGNTLIPRDLKDYIAADLKIPRRQVEFQQPFRSRFTLRVNDMNANEAMDANRQLIESSMEYFRRDNVTNFINDSLVFEIRLDNDPNSNIMLWSDAEEMHRLIKDEYSVDEFISRCKFEENWDPSQ